MLSADETYASLVGAWRLMFGKADGLRLLDLSADGFWNSFYAIVVAAPALIVGWVGIANEIGDPEAFAGRLGMLIRLATVDIGSWVLPLVALALVAPRAGIGGRFVHYVVASNWASAIIAWLMLPSALLRLFLPSTSEISSLVSLFLFALSALLTWRMTNASIGKGAAVGTAVFVGMFIASLLVLFGLQALLGIDIPDSTTG
ncbi:MULTISPECIES: transporter [unclassified Mesorhizobium]|uniref:transporter n=1 Tax=unclassified Mesorhizobium TaxID=325217 RepID=UPI000F765513|nr:MULTISPECIES: transporter [unclassified Mesorhizobium]AZO07441.1 transporter [Mesorhizobium sp. M2A.F.Ca.ET.043.02.1.1]RUW40595.1 transporter [Mesorhizobium sp. M2A.F.Ca.ET.015.02.1.1]RUW80927.1 transporter [Mesorhizobium sp. M2A.F.Ca.ET.067.02.1.1]RVC91150.1 transporter [Mesorhizobium sp. M2A.F.Ca.ET.017.03.2.1]RVD08655.1 transporter [Mesorhizobium sp. M2A.F.Ca.ET.029.05.1.1]